MKTRTLRPLSAKLFRNGRLLFDTAEVPEAESAPQFTDALQLIYIRRRIASNSGLSYAVGFSDALSTRATNPSASETAVSLDTTFERVTVTDSDPKSANRFVHIRVTAR